MMDGRATALALAAGAAVAVALYLRRHSLRWSAPAHAVAHIEITGRHGCPFFVAACKAGEALSADAARKELHKAMYGGRPAKGWDPDAPGSPGGAPRKTFGAA